jgi:hypothetical protein
MKWRDTEENFHRLYVTYYTMIEILELLYKAIWIHVILFVRCCQVIIQSVIPQCFFPLPYGRDGLVSR